MGKMFEDAKVVRVAMDKACSFLTDAQAVEVIALYRPWESGVSYAVGERRIHDGKLYACLQAHDAIATWSPDVSPSLWTKVLVSDTGEALPWEQPDSTNPYMKGDRVTHDGKTWVSLVDNNVWQPSVYGWGEVAE